MLRGLPASGKTVWAKTQLARKDYKVIRINKDDMRAQYFNSDWSDTKENFVLGMRNEAVYRGLARGYDVIVDDTNLAPKHEQSLREIALENKAEFEIKEFPVLLRTALDRNARRPNPVPDAVIHGMWRQMGGNEPRYDGTQNAQGLPLAVICDIDGTVARATRKDHYAIDEKLLTDVPQLHVIEAVRAVARGKSLFFLTGRSAEGSKFTEDWLMKYFDIGEFAQVVISQRASGDSRRDSIVKRELYEAHLKGKYQVIAVFDDRNQVIRECWEPLGLPVFKVGYVDEEF